MTEDLLSNPIWHALAADHSRFAICTSGACRYPSDVAPFAGVSNLTRHSLSELTEMLDPGEKIYVCSDRIPSFEHLVVEEQIPALQMVRPRNAPDTTQSKIASAPLERLGAEDAVAMVGLTDLAFPGYFRPRTYEMGEYYGIRVDGELVAMAGERMALPDHREISGVCTHPAHTGKGYAAQLIRKIMDLHDDLNLISFLHVGAANERAIRLYERLGFVITRSVLFHRLSRPASQKTATQFG